MSAPDMYPLRVPVSHIPYLEKHRIYELFQELARELIIQQPVDHVLFLKQIISNACRTRDTARVIFISSPKVNCLEVAEEMAKATKQIVISENSLLNCLGNVDRADLPPLLITKCLAHLVRCENAYKLGWIMVDCIQTEAEAKTLLQHGILPTHVIHLIPPFYPNLNELLYCNVPLKWPDYRRTITAIRSVFHKNLKEVWLLQRNFNEVARECVELSKIRQGLHFIKPRVLLLGPRGSGRKTQAKLLQENLNIVHVDFEYIICQAWMDESELGKKLRECKEEVCFHSELLAQVVNKRILEEDCLNNGWVLTGYPYTVTDFKHFDSLDTPPNRVIFLECDLNVCKERLRYRRMNACTGSQTLIKENDPEDPEKLLKIHPKDKTDLVDAEAAFYCENYGNIRKYCGNTANAVNGDQCERWVYECITAIITRASPPCPPRKGLADVESLRSSSGSSVCGCTSIPSKIMDCFVQKL